MTADSLEQIKSDATDTDETLPISLYMGFAVGTLGVSLILNVTGALLPAFMTNFLGLSAGAVGTLLFVSKIYDMVTDPVMGIISNQTKSRWGRRRPWILVGSIVAAIGFFMLFAPPFVLETRTALIAYMVVAFFITYTGYTMFNVPYLAMPAEMTDSYDARTDIMTYRTLVVVIGQTIAGGAFWMIEVFGEDRLAHGEMAALLAILIAGSGILCFFATASARQTQQTSTKKYALREQITTALSNKPFLLLITLKFSHLFGLASVQSVMTFFVLAVLQLSFFDLTIYLWTANALIFASLPFWNLVGKRLGKRDTAILSTIFYVVVALSWLAAAASDPVWMYYGRGALMGFAAGGILIMPPAMLPDTMQYDYLRTGLRREGIFSGLYTTVEKAAYAIGPAVVLYVLAFFGYQSSTTGFDVDQPESALTAIYLAVALIPSFAYGVSIICLIYYDLTPEKLKSMPDPEAGSPS